MVVVAFDKEASTLGLCVTCHMSVLCVWREKSKSKEIKNKYYTFSSLCFSFHASIIMVLRQGHTHHVLLVAIALLATSVVSVMGSSFNSSLTRKPTDTSGDCDITQGQIQEFASATSDFTTCIMMNSNPISFCEACAGQKMAYVQGFKKLPVNCQAQPSFAGSYQYLIHNDDENSDLGLWDEGYCDACNSSQLMKFHNLTNLFYTCIQTPHPNTTFGQIEALFVSTVCTDCKAEYTNLVNFQSSMNTTCKANADVVDIFRRAVETWQRFNCEVRNVSHTVLYLVFGILFVSPLMFYLTVFCIARSVEQQQKDERLSSELSEEVSLIQSFSEGHDDLPYMGAADSTLTRAGSPTSMRSMPAIPSYWTPVITSRAATRTSLQYTPIQRPAIDIDGNDPDMDRSIDRERDVSAALSSAALSSSAIRVSQPRSRSGSPAVNAQAHILPNIPVPRRISPATATHTRASSLPAAHETDLTLPFEPRLGGFEEEDDANPQRRLSKSSVKGKEKGTGSRSNGQAAAVQDVNGNTKAMTVSQEQGLPEVVDKQGSSGSVSGSSEGSVAANVKLNSQGKAKPKGKGKGKSRSNGVAAPVADMAISEEDAIQQDEYDKPVLTLATMQSTIVPALIRSNNSRHLRTEAALPRQGLVSLNQVLQNLDSHQYDTLDDCLDDIETLFNTCFATYDVSSEEYKQTSALELEFKASLAAAASKSQPEAIIELKSLLDASQAMDDEESDESDAGAESEESEAGEPTQSRGGEDKGESEDADE
eukprot:m.107611 g.107611  ORF g.107611 m.107611 type:complete len:764 (-) comp13325_c0_seq2:558-2849(-)